MNGTIETAFIGRVGTEPERRTSQAGKPWLRFSAAVGSDDAVQWVQVAVSRPKICPPGCIRATASMSKAPSG